MTRLSDRRAQSLVAFAIYLAIAIALLDRGLIGARVPQYLGTGTDPPMLMWFLKWWPYAIAHRLNPFWTHMVWAPMGVNLAWTTCVPLLAMVSAPIQSAFGLITAYNTLVTVAMPAAALCAFILCRRLTHAFWPSILGGYLFGFSPYMLGRALGHLSLLAVFPIPLIAIIALRRIAGEISARRYAAMLALMVVIEFLCAVELFATITVFGAVAILLAIWLFDAETRSRIAGLIAPTAVAYAISIALLSPYFYFLFARGIPHAPLWDPGRYSADLLNFVIPTTTAWIGAAHPAAAIAASFGGYVQETGAYLGIPLIVLAEDFRRRNWATPAGKFLILLLLILLLAALGPALRIMGRETFSLPWALMLKLPLISSALPARFMIYADLVIAIIGALWFAGGARSAATRSLAAVAIAISLFPNPHASFWTSPLELPAFFARGGAYRTELKPHELVLVLPFGQRGSSMYWQARTDMYFRMAGGYTGPWPFVPVLQFFYGGVDLPEAGDQLKAYLARFGVQAVVVDRQAPLFPVWRRVLESLGIPPSRRDGFSVYKIPPEAFAAYGKLSPVYLETRAVSIRCDTILEAVAKYLAAGHNPAQLSPSVLKQQGLLPADWLIDTAPDAYQDWGAFSADKGKIGIAVAGSYPAVKPLIDRYRDQAVEIFYPAPVRWTPASKPQRDLVKPLLLIFDRTRLVAAAEQLRSSPPPELITPFLGAAGAEHQAWPTADTSTRRRPGPVSGSR
ncbi:MAG TPA: hypothetical protein VMV15_15115 [Candidatus Binataceae bacterium]|nr:hypothetical protein [Candidatus Binataceae bacterium]